MARIDDPVTAVSWRSGWFCLTISDRLAEEGQHVTVDLPDLSVTVQRFRGGLGGFWNVCSHRGTQMRHAGCGSGQLRCPYHGWVYNADGVPVGIPENDMLFGLDATSRVRLALRPVEVAMQGRFVFIRVDPGPQPLALALGAAATALAGVPDVDAALLDATASATGPLRVATAGMIGYRNLSVGATEGGSLAEITLPNGENGCQVTHFRFGVRT